jgi:hypothetical protein
VWEEGRCSVDSPEFTCGVTRVLQGWYKDVTRVLRDCNEGIKDVSKVLQECCKDATRERVCLHAEAGFEGDESVSG